MTKKKTKKTEVATSKAAVEPGISYRGGVKGTFHLLINCRLLINCFGNLCRSIGIVLIIKKQIANSSFLKKDEWSDVTCRHGRI